MNNEISLGKALPKPVAIVAVFNILVITLLYVIDSTQLGSGMISFGLGVINLLLIGYLGVQYRNDLGGYAEFGKMFLFAFLVLFVSATFETMFRIILFTVIDPDLPMKLAEGAVETLENTYRMLGMDDDAIDKAMEAMTVEDMAANYSPGKLLIGLPIAGVLYAIGAAIIAAIIKKKDPTTF